jgi:hypothetical protein
MHARRTRWQAALPLALLLAASSMPVAAATKTIDLDAQSTNGAESKCDLNVLQTFPVQIENVVTNKAVGDAFNFSWPSAGPGGFSSASAPGTLTGRRCSVGLDHEPDGLRLHRHELRQRRLLPEDRRPRSGRGHLHGRVRGRRRGLDGGEGSDRG